jgi:transcriptional regulator GlxA family with amidase domain
MAGIEGSGALRTRAATLRMDGMAAERRVVVLAYDGAQSLDVTGPVEVFDVASRHGIVGPYRVEVIAPSAAPIVTTSGITLTPAHAIGAVDGPLDTFIVAGGDGVSAVLEDADVLAGVRRLAGGARRVASVCTGAFLLAEAGLLDGRRVTTHWARCRRLARSYPDLDVDPDPIFVRDGDVYTSAGVTAGIDLCLALVEEDHGRDLALAVARQLVVFLKRPGGQAQFSSHLSTQLADHDALAAVQGWVADHLADDLSVPRLAERAAMSPRHFARVFRAETGVTPARFVEQARVELARRRLEESSAGIEAIARDCGFGTPETMRRAFLRSLWVGPSEYRQRFRATTVSTVEV